ncbi:uncharacterized protein LOC141852465 [Brevipalpus obovatus]|uniref:uncharacterized protein LOC141852465 n=1 Tax=Brevipalpus obovatus TaxID=246614 RepID=UPI003D9F3412
MITIFPFLVATSHSQIVSDSSNDTSDLPIESEREGIPEAVTISDRQEPEFDFKTFQSRSDRVWYMYCNKPTVDEEMLKEFTLCYGPQLPHLNIELARNYHLTRSNKFLKKTMPKFYLFATVLLFILFGAIHCDRSSEELSETPEETRDSGRLALKTLRAARDYCLSKDNTVLAEKAENMEAIFSKMGWGRPKDVMKTAFSVWSYCFRGKTLGRYEKLNGWV